MPSSAFIVPSFKNGFARSAGESRYPHLWRGLVGAWAPCLGPTGNILPDWSGRWNRGTLTNFNLATAWTQNEGRHAILSDGSNDQIGFGSHSSHVNAVMSVSFWLRMPSTPSRFQTILMRVSSSAWSEGWGFWWEDATPPDRIRFFAGPYATNYARSSVLVPTVWNHIVGICDGTNTRIVTNGVDSVTGAVQSSALLTGTCNLELANTAGGYPCPMLFDDLAIYHRVLSDAEIRLLSSRRGILYERAIQTSGYRRAILFRRSLTNRIGSRSAV